MRQDYLYFHVGLFDTLFNHSRVGVESLKHEYDTIFMVFKLFRAPTTPTTPIYSPRIV